MSLAYVEYRVRLIAPLRVAEAYAAHAAQWPRVPSDQLQRALMHAWAELTGEPVDGTWPGGVAAPRIRVSSALPFTDASGPLAPMPASWPGATPEALVRVEAPEQGLWRAEAHADAPWLLRTRVQASFDRRSSRRALRFRQHELHLSPHAGLWFGVRFMDEAADRRTFEAALRLLADTGLGGGRSTGSGTFRVDRVLERALPAEPASRAWWVLSRYRPSEAEYANGALLKGPAAQPHWERWDGPDAGNTSLAWLAEGTTITAHEGLDPLMAGTVVTLPRRGNGARPMQRMAFLFSLPMPAVPARMPLRATPLPEPTAEPQRGAPATAGQGGQAGQVRKDRRGESGAARGNAAAAMRGEALPAPSVAPFRAPEAKVVLVPKGASGSVSGSESSPASDGTQAASPADAADAGREAAAPVTEPPATEPPATEPPASEPSTQA